MFTLETKSHFAEKIVKKHKIPLGAGFFTEYFCSVLNSLDTKVM